MQFMLRLGLAVPLLIGSTGFSEQIKTFAPPNDLHLEDRLDGTTNVSEDQFHKIIDEIVALYTPIALKYGATLTADHLWDNPTVNAFASRPQPNQWKIAMYGGLARRAEVTPDGFALVVCHELGHHFGGFPTYGDWWASAEGNSDYFATQACARLVWKDQHEINATYRDSVLDVVQEKCDSVWQKETDQNLCYRIAAAGYSLGHLLAVLGRQAPPRHDTPDQRVVDRTSTSHPAAQCRLDTYFQGGLCTKTARVDFIPGDGHPEGRTSLSAEHEAAANSCFASDGYTVGVRPRCWFKARFDSEARP